MKNRGKLLLLVLCVVVFACGLSIWAEYSPVVSDYRQIYDRDTEQDLAGAFATALRINHPAAYDMIDPALKPRLDEWMDTHQSMRCKDIPEVFQVGVGQGSITVLSCLGYTGPRRFEVDSIIIKDMRVVNWGEVIDEGW
jgi:hypothetical protein